MDAIHADIKERWRDRYLLQRPYTTVYEQANMNAATTWRGRSMVISVSTSSS